MLKKQARSIIASKYSMISKTFSPSILYHTTGIFPKFFFNSPMIKYKTNVMLIIHIIEVKNTSWYNIK